jgi:hypothetical protein
VLAYRCTWFRVTRMGFGSCWIYSEASVLGAFCGCSIIHRVSSKRVGHDLRSTLVHVAIGL